MPSSSRYCRKYPDSVPASPAPGTKAARKIGLRRRDGIETVWLLGLAAQRGRYFNGIASSPAINSHGYCLASKGCRIQFPIPLLSSHGKTDAEFPVSADMELMRIGEVIEVTRSPDAVHVVAVLDEGPAADHAWQLIAGGETLALSAAGTDLQQRGIVDGAVFFERWRLKEVSVCRKGAVPGARILRVWEQ